MGLPQAARCVQFLTLGNRATVPPAHGCLYTCVRVSNTPERIAVGSRGLLFLCGSRVRLPVKTQDYALFWLLPWNLSLNVNFYIVIPTIY